jgi:molybdenum cofactor biosynthesis enzyme
MLRKNGDHMSEFTHFDDSGNAVMVDVTQKDITKREIFLYEKWYKIFVDLITAQYGDVLKPFKIKTLAKENARYMTSTFINTEMVHTVPLAQLNRIAAYMKKYGFNSISEMVGLVK